MRKVWTVDCNEPVLVTGAAGFIGSRAVKILLDYGFKNIRCFVRTSGNVGTLEAAKSQAGGSGVDIVRGNLLSKDDCREAARGVSVILHLAAGIDKTFAGAFMNSVVTTRNLLEAAVQNGHVKRFVNVSSFAVYSNWDLPRGALLDERCDEEKDLVGRFEPYCYGKAKQDEIVREYSRKYGLPYVIVRPGAVYGPGKKGITARVGIDTFGVFLHLGGSNQIPVTYVDNCAEAIVRAGIVEGIEGEVFNIVDDDLPSSRRLLKMYKKAVGGFKSIYVPYRVFYFFCLCWEKYAEWSEWQLPPVFNRRRCVTYWKGNRYSNRKLKRLLGWKPRVSIEEGWRRYCEYLSNPGGTK